MRIREPAIFLALALTAQAAQAQGVHKCVDASGAIMFQDRPCAKADPEPQAAGAGQPGADPGGQTDAGAPAPDGFTVMSVPVPGVGQVEVMVFGYMDSRIRDNSHRGVTIDLETKQGGDDPVSMALTFLPNDSGMAPPIPVLNAGVRSLALQQPEVTSASKFQLRDIETGVGRGRYAAVEDLVLPEDQEPGTGFTTSTVGKVASPEIIVEFIIRTNGTGGQAFRDAMEILRQLLIS
jgi:hypothetical protein